MIMLNKNKKAISDETVKKSMTSLSGINYVNLILSIIATAGIGYLEFNRHKLKREYLSRNVS